MAAAAKAAPAAPMPPPIPPEPSPEMMTATVARGRTVVLAGRSHGPGTVLELSVDDHAHLLAAGFLVDPRVPLLVPGIGPMFTGATNGIVRPQ